MSGSGTEAVTNDAVPTEIADQGDLFVDRNLPLTYQKMLNTGGQAFIVLILKNYKPYHLQITVC